MANREKTIQLSAIDLALVAPLSREDKYKALSSKKSGFPPYYYNAVRESFADIFRIAGPLLGSPAPSWPKIRATIRKACRRSTAERIANVQVGSGLHHYSLENNVEGKHHAFRPLIIASHQAKFWSDAILRIGDRLYVPFFDPRRTKGLNREAMRFVFSVMHEHIRVPDPDFAEVGFVIFRFANTKKGPRRPIPFFDSDFELWSYEEIDRMVRETYEVLTQVLADRTAKSKKEGKAA